jgi:hypothetical protein
MADLPERKNRSYALGPGLPEETPTCLRGLEAGMETQLPKRGCSEAISEAACQLESVQGLQAKARSASYRLTGSMCLLVVFRTGFT